MSRLKNDVKPSVSWPPSRHVKPPDDIPRGILLMIAATVLFAVWSAIGKWQVAIYPVGEVMFLRSISSFIVCMAVVLPFTGMSVFATQRRRDHIARGLSQAVSQTFTIIAFGLMPLAGAIAINFSAPLWAALLSIVWLKERAGPARWTALLCGFFGVLIVANPGVNSLTLGALFALANAVMFGSVTVAVRGMTKTEPTSTLLMWQMATLATPRVRLSMAHSRRCGHADGERGCQCRRPVSLDEVASLGTSRGGIAILLSDAGMGACNRVPCVGRRADGWTCRRLSCCGRIRAILAVA